MPPQPLPILIIVVTAALCAGCADREPGPTPPPVTAGEWRDTFYRFDDPRCSEDQQRAIRVATKAVIGTDQPSASVSERLHFTCTESADGWSLTVWQFGADEMPVPGGFTAVELNRDFSVRGVRSGA